MNRRERAWEGKRGGKRRKQGIIRKREDKGREGKGKRREGSKLGRWRDMGGGKTRRGRASDVVVCVWRRGSRRKSNI